jgi:hypothetical protein
MPFDFVMPLARRPCRPLLRRSLSLLAALLVACGGGGGSSDTPPLDASVSFTATDLDFPTRNGHDPQPGRPRHGLRQPAGHPLRGGRAPRLRPLRLDAWRDASLPDSLLNQLDDAFARVRRAGLKLVLRVSYNDPAAPGSDPRDASLVRIHEHIARLAPTLAANADVIAYWQAGFIGAWGEWHDSTNGLDDPDARLAVRDALLAALPPGRSLQFRQPADLQRWYPRPRWRQAPAPRPDRPPQRLLSADDTDVGTYPDGEPQRSYIRQLSAVTPFGGETRQPPDPAQARNSCADILREGAEYHVSYLGEDYYTPTFHDTWAAQGCLGTVTPGWATASS